MLTVIIPTLASEKTKPYCEACVASIRKTAPKYRIIVVTNGDSVSPLDVDAEIVHFDKQGQCHAVNQVAELVDTKYLLVSNDDMLYGIGWDEYLLETVSECRCVSPTLVEPGPGAPPFYNYSCGRTIDKFDAYSWSKYVIQMALGTTEVGDEDIEDGFNLPFLIETEVFNTIGYDEEYDPYGSNSDPDLMMSLMIAGIAPKRDRRALVYHFSLGSGGMDKGEKQKSDWWHNWRYFPQKWGFERDGRNNIWYAAGENGTRIPTKEKPYVADVARGHGIHPGKDWLEFTPSWMGKYGEPIYGKGNFHDQ